MERKRKTSKEDVLISKGQKEGKFSMTISINVISKMTTKNPGIWHRQSSLIGFLEMTYLSRDEMTQEQV